MSSDVAIEENGNNTGIYTLTKGDLAREASRAREVDTWVISGTPDAYPLVIEANGNNAFEMTFIADDGTEQVIRFTKLRIKSIVHSDGRPLPLLGPGTRY